MLLTEVFSLNIIICCAAGSVSVAAATATIIAKINISLAAKKFNNFSYNQYRLYNALNIATLLPPKHGHRNGYSTSKSCNNLHKHFILDTFN